MSKNRAIEAIEYKLEELTETNESVSFDNLKN